MTCKQESVLLTVAAYQMVFIYDNQRRKKLILKPSNILNWDYNTIIVSDFELKKK